MASLTDIDLLQVIAKVRRAMPRNPDVMAVCDGLETRLRQNVQEVKLAPAKPRFDKRAYQREYMRKRRAGK